MSRIPVAALSIVVLFGSSFASARVHASGAAASGRVQGYVRDAVGTAVADASVLAVGLAVVSAKSDVHGRFQMALPPGDYVLKATRSGYVSTYREPVRVHSSVPLERVITLIRQADAASAAANVSDSHAHTELAWQLRHLPRSVLRDSSGVTSEIEGSDQDQPLRPAGTLFGRAVDSSLRLASRIADTDFRGQVNFFTTSLANPTASFATTLPRSVAYVVVGAPVGDVGDWRIRGAVGSGPESSWNLIGEYSTHESETHAVRAGVSFSSHGATLPGLDQWSRQSLDARSVAGAFAEDVWHPLSDLQVEYAVRADRYDFLADPYLLSASGGIRAQLLPATWLSIHASRSMLAPGAEEFLPPPSDGPWLPPERTFVNLASRDEMRAETVRHVEMMLAHTLGITDRALHVRAFTQQTTDQIATLFGGVGDAPAGHYRVARAGMVAVSGWAVGLGGTLAGPLTGQIEYSRMAADWSAFGRTRGLRRAAPSTIRAHEWIDDVTATLEASTGDARTRVSVVYRANSAFSDDDGAQPKVGSRFDVQFHQALPYRPTPESRVELLFAVRTLFRDPQSASSRYDELLTVAPPLRLMGGIQVRF